jgi:hypothetical protein
VKVGDRRVSETVGVEELGLGDTTVGTLAVPPAGSIGVEVSTARTLDGDLGALDLQERAIPLLVAPGRLTLEDDLVGC